MSNTPDYSHITIPSRDDRKAYATHMAAVSLAWGEGIPLLMRGCWPQAEWKLRLEISAQIIPDWYNYEYALAPEPPKKKLVPWEVTPALIGRLVKNKTNTCIQQIDAIMADAGMSRRSIQLAVDAWRSPNDLLDCYVEILPDGTEVPCGTEVDT